METNELAPLVVAFVLGVVLPVALVVRLGGAIFPSRARQMIKQHPFIHLVWLLAAVVAVFSIFVVPQLIARDAQRRQAGKPQMEGPSNTASHGTALPRRP
jgi:hypothetical protein